MNKLEKYLYQVTPTERVTIEITPSVNLGKLYTAVLDSTPLDKPADGKYSFPVTKPLGQTHFFSIEFGFLGAPAGAKYQLAINGNSPNNSGPFTPSVVNGDPVLKKQFKFTVVKEPI